MALPGVPGRGNEGLFRGFRVSVLQEEKSSGVWLCNSVNTLNCSTVHLNLVKMVYFVIYISPVLFLFFKDH